jgi:hypothetical protein
MIGYSSDGFYWHVFHGESEFVALAKREPFINGHPIKEPGDVWFEFGATAADAVARLRKELIP